MRIWMENLYENNQEMHLGIVWYGAVVFSYLVSTIDNKYVYYLSLCMMGTQWSSWLFLSFLVSFCVYATICCSISLCQKPILNDTVPLLSLFLHNFFISYDYVVY